jgi:hypothetical protein
MLLQISVATGACGSEMPIGAHPKAQQAVVFKFLRRILRSCSLALCLQKKHLRPVLCVVNIRAIQCLFWTQNLNVTESRGLMSRTNKASTIHLLSFHDHS